MGCRRLSSQDGQAGSGSNSRAQVRERGWLRVWVARRSLRLPLLFLNRDNQLNKARIKDAHRRIMLANHPDRGGSPYMASKCVLSVPALPSAGVLIPGPSRCILSIQNQRG